MLWLCHYTANVYNRWLWTKHLQKNVTLRPFLEGTAMTQRHSPLFLWTLTPARPCDICWADRCCWAWTWGTRWEVPACTCTRLRALLCRILPPKRWSQRRSPRPSNPSIGTGCPSARSGCSVLNLKVSFCVENPIRCTCLFCIWLGWGEVPMEGWRGWEILHHSFHQWAVQRCQELRSGLTYSLQSRGGAELLAGDDEHRCEVDSCVFVLLCVKTFLVPGGSGK